MAQENGEPPGWLAGTPIPAREPRGAPSELGPRGRRPPGPRLQRDSGSPWPPRTRPLPEVPLLLVGQHGLCDGQLVGAVGPRDVLRDSRHNVRRVLHCARRPGGVLWPPPSEGPRPGQPGLSTSPWAQSPESAVAHSRQRGAPWRRSHRPCPLTPPPSQALSTQLSPGEAANRPHPRSAGRGEAWVWGRCQASPVLWASSLLKRSLQARSWKKLLYL